MSEFLNLAQPKVALKVLLDTLDGQKPLSEVIETRSAFYRVTAESIYSPHPLPTFHRSTVDGYAVQSLDTYGASENSPVYLSDVGEVLMGESTILELAPLQAALIHTGGMLPFMADAVVMVENTQISRKDEIEIFRAVAPGENTISIGEDVTSGEEVIPIGTRLRSEEIGGLLALGLTKVNVVCKPRVGIISSGDEVIPPENELLPGQVRDINAYTLSTIIQEYGGMPVHYGIVPDKVEYFESVAKKAIRACDALVITAGSSASARDYTAQVINSLGEPGVLVHGINIRPGKPTVLAVCNGKPVIGLPGNPVSALVIARLFVIPVIETLLQLRTITGHPSLFIKPSIRARLSINLASQAGREDWIPVKLTANERGCCATPLFGKSNLIFTLVRSDGFICIPPDVTGVNTGEIVEVFLF